jgi:opacity protein-like surface antigen
VKTLFAGAGPHVALENTTRFEPWIHGLIGLEHFRLTQGATLGSNSTLGYMVGGGLDFRITPKIFWRVQGDYLGTRFQSALQSNYSTGTGIVLYF